MSSHTVILSWQAKKQPERCMTETQTSSTLDIISALNMAEVMSVGNCLLLQVTPENQMTLRSPSSFEKSNKSPLGIKKRKINPVTEMCCWAERKADSYSRTIGLWGKQNVIWEINCCSFLGSSFQWFSSHDCNYSDWVLLIPDRPVASEMSRGLGTAADGWKVAGVWEKTKCQPR